MATVVQSQPQLPMTQDGIKRKRLKIPNMNWLDMSTRWQIRQTWIGGNTKYGTVRVTTSAEKCTLADADSAIDFAKRAFAYHGWELLRGAISPDPRKELSIHVELEFEAYRRLRS